MAHTPATALIPTTPVFTNGDDGIACYRIPSLVAMPSGTLLAFAEARVNNCIDHGPQVRVVLKRSTDGGQTWGPLMEISRNVLPDGEEQIAQNPCPVVDTMDPACPRGKVVLMFNKAETGESAISRGETVRRFYITESPDDGQTWTPERDITADVHRPNNPTYTRVYADAAERYAFPDDWRANFPAVGHGIQLRGGADGARPTRGRLVVPIYITVGTHSVVQGQVYLAYSNDHGTTWQHDDPAPVIGVNEMMAVERANGDLLINFRNYTGPNNDHTFNRGQLVFTLREDGSFAPPSVWDDIPNLRVPGTGLQASIIRIDEVDAPGATDTLLISGADHLEERIALTIWRSDDEGATWPRKRLLDPGPAAYADMIPLPTGRIGMVYERGDEGGIVFTTFAADDIDEPDPNFPG